MPELPLVHELIPAPDPWEVAQKLAHLPHLLFLDSSDRHPTRGRYSYVMADPTNTEFLSHSHDSSSKLFRDEKFKFTPTKNREGLPPFTGGWAGMFGYHLGRTFDRQPDPLHDDFGMPDLAIGMYDWVVSFDHETNRAWIISTGKVNEKSDSINHFKLAQDRLDRVLDLIRSDTLRKKNEVNSVCHCFSTSAMHSVISAHSAITSNFSRDGYLTAVQKVIDYIHAGDVFQVNLSQRLQTPLTEHPLELYGRLRKVSPSPYGCYFDAGEFQILSASPEQFLQVSPNGDVVTRPIKGTRPRGKTPAEDVALLRDLTTNPKDHAENVMIVDLMRNDIGRVCEYGSVHVPKVCEVETYNYVHHLVSEVRGKLLRGKTPFDLLKACFPGGSVTGAPKVRAMEIIAELEPTARGPYCGSVGFIGFDGAMDSNILIRTFTAGKGWLQFPVGGGIVADSIPEKEYEETLHKAAGLMKALKVD